MTIKFKKIESGEYITAKPLAKNVYGYVRKNENDFGSNTIWACGLCEKDFTIIEAIMTEDTKALAIETLIEYADYNINVLTN